MPLSLSARAIFVKVYKEDEFKEAGMKHILKEGEISVLLPEGQGGALSGEVHLIKHNDKKYVVRKCENLQTAKYYEEISKKLERYNFLPKLLGRFRKNVLYEFIDGRDLRQNEKSFVFEELGKIGAHVNNIATPSSRFNLTNALNELVSGKYAPSRKVLMRRKRSNIRKRPRAVLQKKEAEKIKKLYKVLLNKTKAKFSLDIADYR